MADQELTAKVKGDGAIVAYIVGFSLSVLLTVEAYQLVVHQTFSGTWLIVVLLVLALTQFVVQLVFFLHLGREAKSQWNVVFLLSTIGIVSIVVVGAIWIMSHLEYNMKPSLDVNQVIMEEEGIQK